MLHKICTKLHTIVSAFFTELGLTIKQYRNIIHIPLCTYRCVHTTVYIPLCTYHCVHTTVHEVDVVLRVISNTQGHTLDIVAWSQNCDVNSTVWQTAACWTYHVPLTEKISVLDEACNKFLLTGELRFH